MASQTPGSQAPPTPNSSAHAQERVAQGGTASSAKSADWERIELDYRAGVKTLRQIADEHGITHGAVNKRAKRDGWERDLSGKIHAKADALVSMAAVSNGVSKEARIAETLVMETNARAIADVRLSHRKDIHRARNLTNALLDELEQQTDPETLGALRELGDLLRKPDDRGQDKLNDIYQAVISLPERSKTMKVLAESLQKLVDMERVAFSMDAQDKAAGVQDEGKKALDRMATAEILALRERVSLALARSEKQEGA